MPIFDPPFHAGSTSLNKFFHSQCIQESEEGRSFDSEQKNNLHSEQPDGNDKINNPNKSDPDDSPGYFENNLHLEQPVVKNKISAIIKNDSPASPDDSENSLHLELPVVKDEISATNKNDPLDCSDDFENNLHLEQPVVKDEISTTNKNESPDSSVDFEVNKIFKNNLHPEKPPVKYKMSATDKNDSSDSSDVYEITVKEKKIPRSKVSVKKKKIPGFETNLHLQQSTVENKKYTSDENYSSDESELPSPDSSDEWEMYSNFSDDYDSSDDYRVTAKKQKNQKSKLSKKNAKNSKPKRSSKKSTKKSKPKKTPKKNVKNSRLQNKRRIESSSDEFENESQGESSADETETRKLSEYEKMIQKNRDEKLAFLQSLRMDEVKKGLGKLKPKKIERKKSVTTPKGPPRKSRRLANDEVEPNERLSSALAFERTIFEECVYADFVRDFDDLDYSTPNSFTDYMSCFTNMKTDPSKNAKVVNGRLISMALHPMKEKVIVCVGNNCGFIGFWNMSSNSLPYRFKTHVLAVSCLKFNVDSPHQIVSCSEDGTMRCGDMEKRVFYEVFRSSEESPCLNFDFLSPSTTLVCHQNGYVSLVDMRSDSKSAQNSYKCHQAPMKTVSVHPVNKSYFVSTDRKGFLSLWDLRMLQLQPVIEMKTKGSMPVALFSPVTGNSILTTSYIDDSLSLYDSSKLGDDLPLYKEVCRYKGPSPRLFKASWLPNTDDAFVVGSLEKPARIEVYNNQLDNIYSFQDDCIITTFCDVFHPSLPLLAGGSYSGRVFIFS